MESEASCRSTAASEDEVERCDGRSDERSDDCCCCCSSVNCPPHIFTSILLGLLACVLVSGGVFLAFHKWDHTWLLVSAVGVILMIIGTALHCCSTSKNDRKVHRCKGGCSANGRSAKPDALSNGGGLLTEQLLPLSNARSVSQLSLNMVPGYFPPLVYPSASGTPYGLEQHSAVVQNISRLVQHQQQLHLQAPSTTGDGARSFILLSLPADANAANIQNLVNAVCQLDASNQSDSSNQDAGNPNVPSTSQQQAERNSTSATPATTQSQESPCVVASTSVATTTTTTAVASVVASSSSCSQPALKHAEVQTYVNWPLPATSELKTQAPASTNRSASDTNAGCTSSTTAETACQAATSTDIPRADDSVCLVDIEGPPQTTSSAATECGGNLICDTEELPIQIDIPLLGAAGPPVADGDLIDITTSLPVEEVPAPGAASGTTHSTCDASTVGEGCGGLDTVASDNSNGSAQNGFGDTESRQGTGSSDLAFSTSDLPTSEIAEPSSSNFEEPVDGSSSDFEEDSELLDRSSPPPSYEDVTQEVQSPVAGALGLAYGTL